MKLAEISRRSRVYLLTNCVDQIALLQCLETLHCDGALQVLPLVLLMPSVSIFLFAALQCRLHLAARSLLARQPARLQGCRRMINFHRTSLLASDDARFVT
jgi:hypothetical protein